MKTNKIYIDAIAWFLETCSHSTDLFYEIVELLSLTKAHSERGTLDVNDFKKRINDMLLRHRQIKEVNNLIKKHLLKVLDQFKTQSQINNILNIKL